MRQEKQQANRIWLWIGAAVLLVAVFFLARLLLRERLPVRVAQVHREAIANTVSTNGRVEPEHPWNFYSPLATTVKAVYAQNGDTVPKGKLLILLDDTAARAQVATAQSGVKAAQALIDAATHNGTQAERQSSAAEVAQNKLNRDQAQRNVDALTRLAATGAASTSEVASARQRLAGAQASLDASQQMAQNRYSPVDQDRARAALADAQAALAAAEHVLNQTRIVAPAPGTIFSLDAAPTEFAEAGKRLLQMADLKQQHIRAYFDEPDIGRLALNQFVDIRWDARPGEAWKGHIVRMPAAVVQYTTRIVGEVMIALDSPENGLLPETNVTVQVTTSSQANALSIPRESLHSESGRYYVYKIVGTELRRTPVTIGAPNLTQVPILTGLNEGDLVATSSTTGQPLQEGIPIKVQR